MADKHIIYLPGKNPKPHPAAHRELLWKVLVEGVRQADSSIANKLQINYTHFHLINWNYLFYCKYKDITPDIPWIDTLLNKHGPTEQDIQEVNSWRSRLGWLLFTLADYIPLLIPLLPKEVGSAAKEINNYFDNTNNIALEIRKLLKHTLRPLVENNESVLLIGHSLGSVIAYDTLWELSHEDGLQGKVDFLTLGSPLGMQYVQSRLMGMNNNNGTTYTTLIRRWINIASEGDIIALERNFNERFSNMLDQKLVHSIEDHTHGIYNFYRSNEGLNSHRSYGYLVNPAVGSIIADWWEHN